MSLAVSTVPSLDHVTVLAGEPVDVQLRVKMEFELVDMSNDVMDTGAVGTYVHATMSGVIVNSLYIPATLGKSGLISEVATFQGFSLNRRTKGDFQSVLNTVVALFQGSRLEGVHCTRSVPTIESVGINSNM